VEDFHLNQEELKEYFIRAVVDSIKAVIVEWEDKEYLILPEHISTVEDITSRDSILSAATGFLMVWIGTALGKTEICLELISKEFVDSSIQHSKDWVSDILSEMDKHTKKALWPGPEEKN